MCTLDDVSLHWNGAASNEYGREREQMWLEKILCEMCFCATRK